jgi:hypothetical protein
MKKPWMAEGSIQGLIPGSLSHDINFQPKSKPGINQMPRGGRRTGAGRKPDSLNKRTIEAVKTMGWIGERPIGVLVSAMEDPSAPWSCRIQAASLVADRAFGRAPQSVSWGDAPAQRLDAR